MELAVALRVESPRAGAIRGGFEKLWEVFYPGEPMEASRLRR